MGEEEKERLGLKGVEWVEKPLKKIDFKVGSGKRGGVVEVGGTGGVVAVEVVAVVEDMEAVEEVVPTAAARVTKRMVLERAGRGRNGGGYSGSRGAWSRGGGGGGGQGAQIGNDG